MEDKLNIETANFDLGEIPLKEVEKPAKVSKKVKTVVQERPTEKSTLVSCLRNEKIIVRHIPKTSGIWGNNPKHVLSGGIAENSFKTFVIPKLMSGLYVNILTDSEKAFLEEVMGLEYNALSIYKKNDNFWDDSNPNGINRVRLQKQDNYFDLSNPEDYIKYKILLANKDFIAPSLQAFLDLPKATYQFVIISEGEETKSAKLNMSNTMRCYKEFGKVENDLDTLRVIVETIEGKPTSKSISIEFLQTRINNLIQTDSKLFLKVITDTLLPTKVMIKKAVEEGIISNRGGYLYLRETNEPLCEQNEEPTLNTAAIYLNSPKHQEMLFSIQSKLK